MGETDQTTSPAATAPGQRAIEHLEVWWVFPDTSGRVRSRVGRAAHRVGRGEDCETTLPGTETSRHHATIAREGQFLVIRDNQSTNGVFVRGVRVSDAPLQRGSVVRCGEWVGVVTAASDTSPRTFGEIAPDLWAGPHLASALEPLRAAASSDLPIVIEGETGTGKECVARAVHAWSGRAGPFVAVNCAALPETLAESELFGYRRGAFTGAEHASRGQLRASHKGTLLLDEIADLSRAIQAKLLRALEQHEVVPLGASEPEPIDLRVVAAAQASLAEAIETDRFRADLFARLDGVHVRIPPLRERPEEVPSLFQRFARELAGNRAPSVDARVVERLCTYDWPFNVRELYLLVKKLLTLHGHVTTLTKQHLPARIVAGRTSGRPSAAQPRDQAPEATRFSELDQLRQALQEHRGNVTRAAADVGISRQRAYRLIERCHDIDIERLRQRDRGGAP